MRRYPHNRCSIALKALILFLCGALAPGLAPHAAAAEDAGQAGKIHATGMYTMPLNYACTVEEVFVAPGSVVKEGQLLARYRLEPEAALGVMQYLSLHRGIMARQAEIAKLDISIVETQKKYDENARLSSAQMGAADLLQSLRQTLTLMRRQRELSVKQIEEDRKDLRVRQAITQRNLGVWLEPGVLPEFGELRSHLAGEVLLMDPALRPGALVRPLGAAFTIAKTNPMEVLVRVYESEAVSLHAGDKAKVRVLALDDREYDARVARIDRLPDDMGGDRPSYYGVRVSIPNDDGALRPGLRTVVRFSE